MAKYYLRLLMLFGGVIAIVAIIGSLLPRSFDFQTSLEIDAPPEQVFPYLNSLPRWQEWSRQWNPNEIDNLEISYNGTESGVGAAQSWTDPRGSGKLWITVSDPNERVEYEIDFAGRPRMSSQLTLIENDAGSTIVQWRSTGRLPAGPFYGYFGSFFSTHMSNEYDNSLARLKQLVEVNGESADESSED